MATPFFRGNYGSALSRVDTRPVIEAGRATGQMYAGLGKEVGGMIKEYGLNKQKRAKLTGEIEAYYKENPEALSQIGMSGDEAQDKKDFTERERFVKGDMSMAQLEGYAGKLARGEVLRSKKLQDDARRTLNETNKFNLDLAQELKGTTIALAEAKQQRADTENRVANMSEEQLLALAKLTTEERRLALQGSIDKMKAFTGTERGKIEKQSAELTKQYQEQALEQGAERLTASKSANKSYDTMVNAMGGLKALTQFEIQGRKLNHEKIRSSMALQASQGKAMELNAVARVIAAGNIDLGKKYLDLHSQRGKLMDTTLTNPMGGGEITFSEYLKLNDAEGDNDYPLTGSNAGFAERLNARYKAIGLEMDQLLQITPVQVDDGSGGAGAPKQDRTGTLDEKSASELIAKDLIPPMLNPAQEQGALGIAESITSAIPQVISDEALEQLAQEFLDKTNPDAVKILQTPRGQEAFQRLMQKRQASGLGRGAIGI